MSQEIIAEMRAIVEGAAERGATGLSPGEVDALGRLLDGLRLTPGEVDALGRAFEGGSE